MSDVSGDGPGLTGRTVVITGASDGVGAATARGLAGTGARLILVGRSPEKTKAVAAETDAAAGLVADFAKLDDVRRLAARIRDETDGVDVLLNNAGGLFDPSQPTADGFEPNAQINHLAPFLLTHLLRDRLAAGGGALVLNTSSIANLIGRVHPDRITQLRPSYLGGPVYGASKLMNILFSRGIQARWADDGIVSAAIHPGAVASRFARDAALAALVYRTPLKRVFLIRPETSAKSFIQLIGRGADPELNGAYYHRSRRNGPQAPQARSREVADALWIASAGIVGVEP